MHPTVREYKIPLSVTGVGLLVASILAFAPVLMAESDAEVQTKKNASDLQSLTESLESKTAELQQRLQEQIKAQSSTISRLENQVSILNKATGRMHIKQSTLIEPATGMASEVAKFKTNADTRLTNLEKAVKQMHRRQRTLISQVGSADESQVPAKDGITSLRVTNLEKAVKNLHLKSVAAQNQEAGDASIAELSNRLTSLENAPASATMQLSTRIETLEKRVDSTPQDQSQRLADLEQEILRLSLNRPQTSLSTRYSQTARSSQNDIKRRVDMEVRLMRVERQMKQFENRLEDYNGATREQNVVADQLIEMRTYIDTLLSELYR